MKTPRASFGYTLHEYQFEQKWIRKMRKMREQGLSYGKIADKLNELKIPSRAKRWERDAVWRILKREEG